MGQAAASSRMTCVPQPPRELAGATRCREYWQGRMSEACRDLRIHVFIHLERSAPWSALHAEHPAAECMLGTSFNELRETEIGNVSLQDPYTSTSVTAVCTFKRSVTLDTVAIWLCLAKDVLKKSSRRKRDCATVMPSLEKLGSTAEQERPSRPKATL